MVCVKQSFRRTGSQRLLGNALCFTNEETEVWRRVVIYPMSDRETGRSDLGDIFFKECEELYRNGDCNVSIMVSQQHPAGPKHRCRQMFAEYTVMVNQGPIAFRAAGPIRTKARLLLDQSPTGMSVIMKRLRCCRSRIWVYF